MTATVFVAATADGFIARENGSLDWIPTPESGSHDFGFNDLIASVDAIVMGRATFDFVVGSGQWGYGETPVVVLTNRELDLPEGFTGKAETASGAVTSLAGQLRERGYDHLYVDGGDVIQQFIRAGLVERIIVTQIPVLIGSGISLFGPVDDDVALKLRRSSSFPNGWVQFDYEVL